MRDAATIAKSYIALWNETDPKRRADALGTEWESNATYVDPMMRGSGIREIDSLVAGVHARFPDYRFRLITQPNGFDEWRASRGLSARRTGRRQLKVLMSS